MFYKLIENKIILWQTLKVNYLHTRTISGHIALPLGNNTYVAFTLYNNYLEKLAIMSCTLLCSWCCQTALLSSSTLPSSQWSKTALMLAAENGHLETVTKLIEAGASVDALSLVSAIVMASIIIL